MDLNQTSVQISVIYMLGLLEKGAIMMVSISHELKTQHVLERTVDYRGGVSGSVVREIKKNEKSFQGWHEIAVFLAFAWPNWIELDTGQNMY